MSEDGPFPDETVVVDTAVEAAEDVIFSRIDRGEIVDLDIHVEYEAGELSLDIYLNAPQASADVDQVADDAVLAARSAVDDLHSSNA